MLLLPKFEYHEPSTLEEACQMMAQLRDKARPIAGGTDLLVNMKKGTISPENVVSLDRIPELKERGPSNGQWEIGACTTVAELTAIGRPGILVPLPHALDQDQHHNAGVLVEAGGAIRLPQTEFTPDRLAAEIAALAAEPSRLTGMAAAAKKAGAIDASDRLADLVLRVAGITK